jgi:uncharacterized protein RhaS with RHS repeats
VRPSSRSRPSPRPESLTATNEAGAVTSLIDDSHGNVTNVEDPMCRLTTFTYTSAGAVLKAGDAYDCTTTELHDSHATKRQRGRKRTRT